MCSFQKERIPTHSQLYYTIIYIEQRFHPNYLCCVTYDRILKILGWKYMNVSSYVTWLRWLNT